jgi:hypothetical protein
VLLELDRSAELHWGSIAGLMCGGKRPGRRNLLRAIQFLGEVSTQHDPQCVAAVQSLLSSIA